MHFLQLARLGEPGQIKDQKRSDHEPQIESRLEDFAGNNGGRSFDVDLEQNRIYTVGSEQIKKEALRWKLVGFSNQKH